MTKNCSSYEKCLGLELKIHFQVLISKLFERLFTPGLFHIPMSNILDRWTSQKLMLTEHFKMPKFWHKAGILLILHNVKKKRSQFVNIIKELKMQFKKMGLLSSWQQVPHCHQFPCYVGCGCHRNKGTVDRHKIYVKLIADFKKIQQIQKHGSEGDG